MGKPKRGPFRRLRPFGLLSSRHLQGLLLATAFLVSLLATAGDVGFARDEGFYFQAAKEYQRWFDLLIDDPKRAVGAQAVSTHWRVNSEHPALMKVLFGLSHRLFHESLGLLGPATAYRLPGMLTGCLAVYLIFVWAAALFGRGAGFFAAAAFALMPRVFYHSHLACFDVPITAAWLLTCYLYWRSLSSRRFGAAAGAAFGVALCIKLNAFFLPLVLGAHYLALLIRRRLGPPPKRGPLQSPRAFVWGLVLAPPIFIAHWPWLWHDTWARLGAYLGFHAGHAHYNTAYFGQNIIAAPTPVSLPVVMTAFTVPTTVLILTAVGAALLAVRQRRGDPAPGGAALLLALCALLPIALISLPGVPIFGGTKHWMPAMPIFAMLAGAGAARLAGALADRLARLPRPAVIAAALALLIAPSLQQTATSHPFGLAAYVPLIGGAPGAADLGMLRQFWGYTTAGVIPLLNEQVPQTGRVYFHDTAPQSVEMFREDGALRPDIRNSRIAGSHFALVHHELHMIMVDTYIWNEYGIVHPAHVLTYQGVPMVSVYHRP